MAVSSMSASSAIGGVPRRMMLTTPTSGSCSTAPASMPAGTFTIRAACLAFVAWRTDFILKIL